MGAGSIVSIARASPEPRVSPEPGTRPTSRTNSDHGAVAVELALVIPVLLMLLVGIIEFGRAYSTMISLDGASREGARELALGRTAVEVDAATRASTNITIDSITQVPCIALGHSAKVTVTRQFEFGIPFLPEVTRTLSASSSMRCGL